MRALPRCSAFLAASLDGFIARADGGLDWLAPFQTPGEDYGYQAFADACDAVVIGRKTYDVVLGFGDAAWPYHRKRTIVLTHRATAPRHGEELIAATPVEAAARLRDCKRAYIDGADVIRQFLAAGLLYDLTLSIIPILLGDGVRLFTLCNEAKLVLDDARSYPSGLVQLRYHL
ncbi:MAG TPA: dihydrofolate reductase family protein [Kofleriaceae bacterium]|nr:dihydrofolate reductase family protein [Kofleriaceae bacterium]